MFHTLLLLLSCPWSDIAIQKKLIKLEFDCKIDCMVIMDQVEYLCENGPRSWKTYYEIKHLLNTIDEKTRES